MLGHVLVEGNIWIVPLGFWKNVAISQTNNKSTMAKEQKTRAELTWENSLLKSLDQSHQMSVIWLWHDLRRTRRDCESCFITNVAGHRWTSRYTTEPITVTKATLGNICPLEERVWVRL